MDADVDAVLTLPRPFADSSSESDKASTSEKDTTSSNCEGEVVKHRRSLEEILAAAEEEFDLMDSPVDAAVKTLKSGKEIQRLSAIRNFADLLDSEESCNGAINRVLPAMQELLAQEPSNLDIHCESAVVFKNIIKDKKYTQKYSGLADKLLDYILRNVENQKENVTAAAWLESLVEIADSIPVQSVVELIIPLAISQAESTRRVQRRVISARLVEKLSTIIPPEYVRRDLAPCVQMLCQDPSPAVRTTIAQRISVIAQTLNNSADCVSMLLPCLIELCKDDDPGVREAILNTIAVCLPYFTKESCKTVVIPLLKKCAEQALILRDVSLSVIARQLGPWVQALKDILSDQEQQWFLDMYCRICDLSWRETDSRSSAPSSILYVSCRRMCAYNFPCFAMVYGEAHFNDSLMPLLEKFCKDGDDEVRSTVASGFHEIVQLRSRQEQPALMVPFVELLCSGTAEVVQHLTGNLHRTLPPLYSGFKTTINDNPSKLNHSMPIPTTSRLARRGSSGSTAAATNTVTKNRQNKEHVTRPQLDRILIGCNRVIRGTGSWRSHESYLLNISVLRHLIPINDLCASFVPMLQQEVLTARALPCRIAAAQTLLLIMREFSTTKRRMAIIKFFINDIGGHESCHRRRLLLDIVPFILENYSREFFILEFLPSVLKLANDKVSNIRLQLCRVLSRIKCYLSFPENDAELSKMEKVVSELLTTEQNANTRQLIQQFAVELSRTETDVKERRLNSAKLAEEKHLWTEKETPSPTEEKDNGDFTIPTNENKPNALRRSATTNLAEMPVLSEKAANLAASISNINAIDETERNFPPRPLRLSSPLTTAGALPPSNWRTSRPGRPKMAIVRPQPQITITQRSPSPMPFGGTEGKKSSAENLDERRSKLPLSTARYRSNSTTSTESKSEIIRRKSTPTQQSTTSSRTLDSTLKKYRPKTDSSTLSRRPSSARSSTTISSSYSGRGESDSDNIMTRSASSALDRSSKNYSTTPESESSSLKNIRRPYGLMKVQSTSAVERKPAHMSIRVISMS